MLKAIVLGCSYFFSFAVLATPNAALSERQTLLGLSESSYFVLSTEWEIKNTYFKLFQRVLLKEYGLDSNQLIKSSVLYTTETTSELDKTTSSVNLGSEPTVEISAILSKRSIDLAGYASLPTKKFRIDKSGVFVITEGRSESVLSAEEVSQRIPNLAEILKYDFTAPKVVALHSELSSGITRYFIVVRSGSWKTDINNFEYVISLPEE